MNKPFLSIIIPNYNSSQTIKRCLDSIWAQGLPEDDFEVICVDDCSTDNTLEVLKEEQKSHPMLRIFKNPENLRAGGARNKGVREAKGEYIVFIDSDDYFFENNLKMACDYQKQKRLDILMMDYNRVTRHRKDPSITLKFKNTNILNGADFIKINTCPWGPCKFIFKKDLMTTNELFFVEKVSCEDVDWCIKLVLNALTIQYLPRILSNVIINEQSQTAIEHKKLNTIKDKFLAGSRLCEICNSLKVRNDNELMDYINGVANVYFSEGIKYMTACWAPLSKKNAILKNNLVLNKKSNRKIRTVNGSPIFFSVFSNILSLMVPPIIYFKRLVKGR